MAEAVDELILHIVTAHDSSFYCTAGASVRFVGEAHAKMHAEGTATLDHDHASAIAGTVSR